MNTMPQIIEKNNQRLVDARELHECLGSKQEFANWIRGRIDKYGFEENRDFLIILSKSTLGRPSIEYALTLDTAKELCMVENNQRGRDARKYFIQKEQEALILSSLPDFTKPEIAARAWADQFERRSLAEHKLHQAENVIQLQAPKMHYYEEVIEAKGHHPISTIAKELGMSGERLNEILQEKRVQYKIRDQWVLTSKYQNLGYTTTYTHPYTTSMGEKKSKIHTVWTEKGREFIHNLINPQLQWDKPLTIQQYERSSKV